MARESGHGERAAAELRALQDVFNALFFVAIGMLFDPGVLLRQPFAESAVVAVIVLGKPAVTFLIVAGALISIALNSFLLRAVRAIQVRIESPADSSQLLSP